MLKCKLFIMLFLIIVTFIVVYLKNIEQEKIKKEEEDKKTIKLEFKKIENSDKKLLEFKVNNEKILEFNY